MRRPTHVLAAATMTALFLALAGCGGASDTSAAPAATTSTSAAPSESVSPSASTSASASDDSGHSEASEDSGDDSGATPDFTKQGTKLKFGEKAIVPFKSEALAGALGVTAVGIKKGTTADLAPLKLGDQAKGFTPYYLTFKVTNESGSDYAFTSLGLNSALLGDGSRAQKVTIFGTFKRCDEASAPKSFTTMGASYVTCSLALAGPGSRVTGAQYTAYDESVNKAADTNYFEDPITWN